MTLHHALAVCSRMRDEDRACLDAVLGPGWEAEDFAIDRHQTTGPGWALLDASGAPVAIFGLSLSSAWSCVAWLVGTDAMTPQSWKKLLRFSRTVKANVLNPAHEHHRHRIEAHVLSRWPGAKRFAARLGMTLEGTRVAAGANGEDIGVWAVTAARK